MKVALVSSGIVPLPPTGGGAVEEYVFQLAKHLRKHGIDALAIDATTKNNYAVEEINGAIIARIPILSVPGIKKDIIREFIFGVNVAKYINKLGIDVVHANTAWAGFSIALKKRGGWKLVYTCHNPLWPEDEVHLGEKIVRAAEGYTMRRADLVIALNNAMAKALEKKAKIRREKIAIIPNGVDTEYFKPGIKDDMALKRYNLRSMEYVLFVGRITYIKGVHVLLRAWKEILNHVGGIKLVIAGPLSGSFTEGGISNYAKAMIEYAREISQDSIVFTDSVNREELRILYSNACCLVLPSLAEAFPMVLIEAMASGIPVIGSRAGGIPDIIEDGVNGYTFPVGDYIALAEKLYMLLTDKTLRKNMANAARSIAESKYSWKTVINKLLKVYKAILHI